MHTLRRVMRKELEIVLIILLTLLYGFLIATALRPIIPEGGFDSTLFLSTGKGWLSGRLPYRDLFEHKGPVLYAIQAIAMLPLRSSSMVWGLELLFFVASLLLLRSMARMAQIKLPARCLTYISYILLLATCLEKGNFSEEYSALFTLLGYWALFYATIKGFRVWIGGLMGTMFALLFWIRPNNALPLCCAIIALVIVLLRKKQIRQLLTLTLTGFGSALFLSLLIMVYFHAKGALDHLLDTYFTFNIWYTKAFAQSRSFHGLFSTYYGRFSTVSLGLCVFGTAYVLRGRRQERLRILAVMAGTVVALISCWLPNNPFFHYFIMVMPTLALGLVYFFDQLLEDADKLWQALRARQTRFTFQGISRVALLLAALYCGSVLAHHALGTFIGVKRESITDNVHARLGCLRKAIPPDEYPETLVIATDNLLLWYEVYNQLPPKKYYFGYDYIARADAKREAEIIRQFEIDPPKWILTNAGEANAEPTAGILTEHYTLVGINRRTQLYRLTESMQ